MCLSLAYFSPFFFLRGRSGISLCDLGVHSAERTVHEELLTPLSPLLNIIHNKPRVPMPTR